MGTIAYACVQIPFTALGAVVTDKSGRRPLLLIFALNIKGIAGSMVTLMHWAGAWASPRLLMDSIRDP
ncbi:hypothetical protein ACLOJK_025128 [Asimina triloba]